MSDQEPQLYFNGIDGGTGDYDLPPMSAEELTRLIRGEATPENIRELQARRERDTEGHYGVKEGVNPKDLGATGWGVIFPAYPASDAEGRKKVDAIREALLPLLQWRSKTATDDRRAEWAQGANKGFFVGVDTKGKYLARHGVGAGPADPDKVPYYLLIVGSPDEIPYRFQSQLDVQYAVGRIHFETLDEYAAYAANVIAAESGPARLARQAAFFGVANRDDPATKLSATQLIAPLLEWMQTAQPGWAVESIGAEQATKAALASLLGGDKTPSLLFTASHGMKFAMDNPRQLPHQGALLCQDWPGPLEWGRKEIPADFYFAGEDIASSADLLGLIAFFFACYGGGTPQFNEFARQDAGGVEPAGPEQIAPHPFLARLPVNMLGRPRGALAVVGHVERAWSYSFSWGRAGSQTTVFESTLKRLLEGHPIGSALEYFNERYAELSTVLSDELQEAEFGKELDPLEVAGMWTANNDARGYAILGDPAVRLPVVQGDGKPVARSAIEVGPVPVTRAPGAEAAPGGAGEPPASTPLQGSAMAPPDAASPGGEAAAAAAVTVDVFDKDGKPRDWAWLQQKYKVSLRDAGPGPKFKLVRVDETDGPAVFIADVRDEQGRAKVNQPVAFHWKEVGDLPEAADLRKDPELKSRWFDHALVQRTNPAGDTGFGFGGGSVMHENGGPHTFWVLSATLPSDAISGVGWLGGTNHMGPNRLTFQAVQAEEGGGEGGGGDQEGEGGEKKPAAGDLEARLEAIHADLRKLMKHFGLE